jgi:hypothetical protein
MKLISELTLLFSRKGTNMINQISLKLIMDLAIMQIFYDMHELLPRCHPCRLLSQLTLKFPVLVIDVDEVLTRQCPLRGSVDVGRVVLPLQTHAIVRVTMSYTPTILKY